MPHEYNELAQSFDAYPTLGDSPTADDKIGQESGENVQQL
jgi:hypothetical protein